MSPEIIIALIGVCIPVLGNIAIELIRSNAPKEKTTPPRIAIPSNVSLRRPSPRSKTKNWVFTGIVALILGSVGYFIGVGFYGKNTLALQSSAQEKEILETIRFDYADSPLAHGWNLIEGDSQKVIFEGINDPIVGKALKIATSDDNFYGIDYELQPLTKELGNFLEIVANYPDDQTSLYAYIEMTNHNQDTLYGWLKFKVGKNSTIPSQKTTGEPEWLVYVYPNSFLDQNWVKIQIDLRKTVQETFGKDGWSFHKLIKLRIRGNLWIDLIEISEITSQ